MHFYDRESWSVVGGGGQDRLDNNQIYGFISISIKTERSYLSIMYLSFLVQFSILKNVATL